MKLSLYQVDAFSDHVFGGNPAAVVPLESWLPDALMQRIAAENNLSETTFFVPVDSDGFHIRWFTPTKEVALCGHATLAAAFVLFQHLQWQAPFVEFESLSGPLRVTRYDDLFELDFPAQPGELCDAPERLCQAIGRMPELCLRSEDYLVVLPTEQDVISLQPDFRLLQELEGRGVAVTAPGDSVDFVTRFFAPKYGIDEDPVTGSLYTQLTPYWAQRLNRSRLRARQLSARQGEIGCQLQGDRVLISGRAALYLVGSVVVPDEA